MAFRTVDVNDRPELMAIGDSIFNGVRSLTVNEDLAGGSPPAFLAQALGLSMRQPDYRRPVLFDLEREIREGLDLGRLREHVIDNADRWVEERGEWSNAPYFDNIGIAAAAYGDLHEATAGERRIRVPMLLQDMRQRSHLDFAALYEFWTRLNAAFLLNPSNDPEFEDLTPLEWVASRKPRRLLVNIGSNEGLFRVGATASNPRTNQDQVRQIPAMAKRLAEVLRDHCGDVERIYFNLLLRPRALANLAPRTDQELFTRMNGRYFDRYIGRLGALNGMSGAQMEAFDDLIRAVNDDTRAAMSEVLGERIRFVDLYAFSDRLDAKHHGNDRKVEVQAGQRQIRLSNLPLSANIFGFRHGGLFGIDNMHPTQVGYALLANEMAQIIAETEGATVNPIDIQDAYEADTLVTDPPRSLDSLGFILSFLGAFVGIT